MKAGDVSTTSLRPNCHSPVVSAHQRNVGVNPTKHRLLVRQTVVTMETRRTYRQIDSGRCLCVYCTHSKYVCLFICLFIYVPVLRNPSAAVL